MKIQQLQMELNSLRQVLQEYEMKSNFNSPSVPNFTHIHNSSPSPLSINTNFYNKPVHYSSSTSSIGSSSVLSEGDNFEWLNSPNYNHINSKPPNYAHPPLPPFANQKLKTPNVSISFQQGIIELFDDSNMCKIPPFPLQIQVEKVFLSILKNCPLGNKYFYTGSQLNPINTINLKFNHDLNFINQEITNFSYLELPQAQHLPPHFLAMNHKLNDLLLLIQPNQQELNEYNNLVSLIHQYSRVSLPASTISSFGHWSIHAPLPDDVVSVSLIMQKYNKFNKFGVSESQTPWSPSLIDKLTSQDPLLDNDNNVINQNIKIQNIISKEVNTYSPSPECSFLPISPPLNVSGGVNHETYINFSYNSILDCQITMNNRDLIIFFSLIEEFSIRVGKYSLFKRSLSLIRAYAKYECVLKRKKDDKSDEEETISLLDLLTDNVLILMIMSIFNKFHEKIFHPLQCLFYFFTEYASYNPHVNVITLQGNIQILQTGYLPVKSIKPQPTHLIDLKVLEKYWKIMYPNADFLTDSELDASLCGIPAIINSPSGPSPISGNIPSFFSSPSSPISYSSLSTSSSPVPSSSSSVISTSTNSSNSNSISSKHLKELLKRNPNLILPHLNNFGNVESINKLLEINFNNTNYGVNAINPISHKLFVNHPISNDDMVNLSVLLNYGFINTFYMLYSTFIPNEVIHENNDSHTSEDIEKIFNNEELKLNYLISTSNFYTTNPISTKISENLFLSNIIYLKNSKRFSNNLTNFYQNSFTKFAYRLSNKLKYPLIQPTSSPTSLLDEKINNLYLINFILKRSLTDSGIIAATLEGLKFKGPLPIGEIGKVLAELSCCSLLSHYLKENYGGLKKFIENYSRLNNNSTLNNRPNLFVISDDHPFNPLVYARHFLSDADREAYIDILIPQHVMSHYRKAPQKKVNKAKVNDNASVTSTSNSSTAIEQVFNNLTINSAVNTLPTQISDSILESNSNNQNDYPLESNSLTFSLDVETKYFPSYLLDCDSESYDCLENKYDKTKIEVYDNECDDEKLDLLCSDY